MVHLRKGTWRIEGGLVDAPFSKKKKKVVLRRCSFFGELILCL